jgi:hypothetical protein
LEEDPGCRDSSNGADVVSTITSMKLFFHHSQICPRQKKNEFWHLENKYDFYDFLILLRLHAVLAQHI